MTLISVTYGSEISGGLITATKWNQNTSDIINGLTDGTKDLNINLLTAASITNTTATITNATITTLTPTTIAGTPNFTGNATFAGNVTLGDAAGDATTISGTLAALKAKNIIIAWVAKATGSSTTIDDGVNATSIVRNSIGDYTVTWSITMSSINYLILLGGIRYGTGLLFVKAAPTTTTTTVLIKDSSFALTDAGFYLAIVGST